MRLMWNETFTKYSLHRSYFVSQKTNQGLFLYFQSYLLFHLHAQYKSGHPSPEHGLFQSISGGDGVTIAITEGNRRNHSKLYYSVSRIFYYYDQIQLKP